MTTRLNASAVRRLLADAQPLLEDPTALGAKIGKYALVREVGRGAMGVVYEAIDEELQRRVALKVLVMPLGGSDELRTRFVREAQAAARLDHPGIAAVYEATPQWIAMRFVDGIPLTRAALGDLRTAVGFVRDAARALHHAHEQGVVHRDVKPHNILVEGARAVVTDFGLAKASGLDAGASRSGDVIGSPSYMAPEQILGRSEAVDARTDVWGLGATLFEVVTGHPPHRAPDLVALARKIADARPEPMRHGDRPAPRDLETIALKCLAKEREGRYSTASALADDLDRWIERRPILARRPTLAYRLRMFGQRHRRAVAAAGIAAILLGTLAVGLWNERAARQASAEALALSESIDAVIRDADVARRLGETDVARDRLHAGLATCRAFLRRHDVAHARLLRARIEDRLGLSADAVSDLDAAIDLDPELVTARLERGVILAGQVLDEVMESTSSLDLADAAAMPPDLAARRRRALDDLAVVADARSDLRKGLREEALALQAHLRRDLAVARRHWEEVLRLDPVHIAARVALSRIAVLEGNTDAAWYLAMSAIDLHQGFGPAYAARSGAWPGPLGAGAPGDAMQRVAERHALSAADQRVSRGDQSSEALIERAGARLRLADVDGALADFGAAVERDPRDASAHGLRAVAQARRATELLDRGDRDGALAAWDAAIADNGNAITLEPTLVGARNNRGVCRMERARLLEALGRIDEATQERRRAEVDFSEAIDAEPRYAVALGNRSLIRRLLADRALSLKDEDAAATHIAGARSDVARGLDLKPGDAGLLVERALLRELAARIRSSAGTQGWTDEALADFDAAVRAAPLDPRPIASRGLFRKRIGAQDGAAADLASALRLAPDPRLRREIEHALRP